MFSPFPDAEFTKRAFDSTIICCMNSLHMNTKTGITLEKSMAFITFERTFWSV